MCEIAPHTAQSICKMGREIVKFSIIRRHSKGKTDSALRMLLASVPCLRTMISNWDASSGRFPFFRAAKLTKCTLEYLDARKHTHAHSDTRPLQNVF